MLSHLYQKHQNFVKYAAIGVLNTAVDKGLFLVLFNIAHLNEYLSSFIGLNAGILLSFTLNTLYNYKTNDNIATRFIQFYAINLVGIAITLGLIYIFSGQVGISANIVNIAAVIPVFFVMFLLNRRITFRKSDETAL